MTPKEIKPNQVYDTSATYPQRRRPFAAVRSRCAASAARAPSEVRPRDEASASSEAKATKVLPKRALGRLEVRTRATPTTAAAATTLTAAKTAEADGDI